MSYAPRQPNNNTNTTSSSLRHASSASTSTHSQSILHARIAAKRAELDNLRQLRDLSGNLASQLAGLEQKLSTLRDGAQSVALVLANWDNVLRAINMAAMQVPKPPAAETESDEQTERPETTTPELPVPLVRIPVQPPTKEGG